MDLIWPLPSPLQVVDFVLNFFFTQLQEEVVLVGGQQKASTDREIRDS